MDAEGRLVETFVNRGRPRLHLELWKS